MENNNLSLPKIVFIYNPVSGSGRADYLSLLREQFDEKWDFISVVTELGNIKNQVKNLCDKGFDRIIISGGDGTVMDAVNGIVMSGRKPVIGILPSGTGNDLARILGYFSGFNVDPLGFIRSLAKNMKNPEYREIKVLSVNEKIYFTNYIGIGIDAKIAGSFNKKRKIPIPNKLIFAFFILKFFFQKIESSVQIRFDGKIINLKNFRNILVINIPSYGGGLIRPEGLNPENKHFYLIIYKGTLNQLFSLLECRAPWLCKRLPNRFKPEIYKTDSLDLILPKASYLQIDGEDYRNKTYDCGTLSIREAVKLRFFRL